VFLTSHNLAEVEQLCSNVALMRDGRIVATGTPDGLRGSKASLEDAFIEIMEAAS
jgi:ABC-2 type transport system ATP-binding protein